MKHKSQSTLVKTSDSATRWLVIQSQRIRRTHNVFQGRASIICGVIQAMADANLDLSDCAHYTRITEKVNALIIGASQRAQEEAH